MYCRYIVPCTTSVFAIVFAMHPENHGDERRNIEASMDNIYISSILRIYLIQRLSKGSVIGTSQTLKFE